MVALNPSSNLSEALADAWKTADTLNLGPEDRDRLIRSVVRAFTSESEDDKIMQDLNGHPRTDNMPTLEIAVLKHTRTAIPTGDQLGAIVARALIRLQERYKLTTDRMAKRCGIDERSYGYLKRGNTSNRAGKLVKSIAAKFRLSTMDFLRLGEPELTVTGQNGKHLNGNGKKKAAH